MAFYVGQYCRAFYSDPSLHLAEDDRIGIREYSLSLPVELNLSEVS